MPDSCDLVRIVSLASLGSRLRARGRALELRFDGAVCQEWPRLLGLAGVDRGTQGGGEESRGDGGCPDREKGRGGQQGDKGEYGANRRETGRENPAVGEADKPLRDFSLALLSSIDVDSRSPRDVKLPPDVRKALRPALPFVRPSNLSRIPARAAPRRARPPARFYDLPRICRYVGYANSAATLSRAAGEERALGVYFSLFARRGGGQSYGGK